GMNVVVANTGGLGLVVRGTPTFLIDESNVVSTIPEGQQLQIIGGPVQSDGFTWWNVKNDAVQGWGAIADWLSPNDSAGLRIGAEVTVTKTGGLGVSLRDAPSTTANEIAKIPDGGKMTVLSGPYYVDGYLWWNLKSVNGIGYIAVAYWL